MYRSGVVDIPTRRHLDEVAPAAPIHDAFVDARIVARLLDLDLDLDLDPAPSRGNHHITTDRHPQPRTTLWVLNHHPLHPLRPNTPSLPSLPLHQQDMQVLGPRRCQILWEDQPRIGFLPCHL